MTDAIARLRAQPWFRPGSAGRLRAMEEHVSVHPGTADEVMRWAREVILALDTSALLKLYLVAPAGLRLACFDDGLCRVADDLGIATLDAG